jgi:hypothetical protein
MHLLGQHRSELLGRDSGRAETYCEASHVFATETGFLNHVVSLRYLDDYSRTGEGWRFVCRRLDFVWVEQRKLATAEQIAQVPGRNSPP